MGPSFAKYILVLDKLTFKPAIRYRKIEVPLHFYSYPRRLLKRFVINILLGFAREKWELLLFRALIRSDSISATAT